ncbi:unnamed protein product [Blepharisma stoltei]|uniref:Protein phosphatase 2C n=1 Tax=Blepharisma stoltei TaxID=1481888 RepID=A0AAU9JZR1_9CILI|nr:unnamed protein product [Blepharisma stoltei]
MEPEVSFIINPERETLDDIGVGRNELVLKCTDGLYKGRFFYVNTSSRGEIIGSGKPEQHDVTTYIENANLSLRHAKIQFLKESSLYLLSDLHSDTGTWIKVRETLLPGEPISIDSLYKIGNIIFSIREGEEVSLQSCIISLLKLENTTIPPYNSIEELFEINIESLQISPEQKIQLTTSLYEAKKLPRFLKSLVFHCDSFEFQAHYLDVTIGSDKNCDVVIPNLAPLQARISYRKPWHFLINENEGTHEVYRKLEDDEELPLFSGYFIKIGSLEFEASRFNVGRWSAQGNRPQMEDTDVICHNLFIFEELPLAYYAVYDGHGGHLCSEFLKEHLHYEIRQRLIDRHERTRDVMNTLRDTIIESFSIVDQKFYEKYPETSHSVGSACVACVIMGDRIITINLGDSRAVLCRNGRAINLSNDHKPDNPIEHERIKKFGGKVTLGRLQSRLAVSRAFGDFEYKLITTDGDPDQLHGPLVSIEPDISQIFINPQEDEFLLIACDGLFDAYTSQVAVNIIREKLIEMPVTEQDPNRVVRELVNEAIFQNRTNDNVTAILVNLNCGISSR